MEIQDKQLQMILSVIDYVSKELDWELPIRTGATIQEFYELKLKLERNKELTKEEDMIMVNNIFNEILHGLKINNYNKDIGFSENELNDFFILLKSKWQ